MEYVFVLDENSNAETWQATRHRCEEVGSVSMATLAPRDAIGCGVWPLRLATPQNRRRGARVTMGTLQVYAQRCHGESALGRHHRARPRARLRQTSFA